MNKTRLTPLLLAISLIVLLYLGYWLMPKLLPKEEKTLPVADCDLNLGLCAVALPGGGTMTVEITPRPIPVLKPLDIRLSLEGHAAQTARLYFSGVEMDMGFNPITLQEKAAGQFTGQGALPVCVTGHMRWRATFVLENAQGTLAVPLEFNSGA